MVSIGSLLTQSLLLTESVQFLQHTRMPEPSKINLLELKNDLFFQQSQRVAGF